MYLTGKRTYWMQLYSASTVKYSPITPPTLVADYDLLVTGSVTIHCTDPVLDPSAQGQLKGDWFKQMPLLAMNSNWDTKSANGGSSTLTKTYLGGTIIDFNNSYVNFQNFAAPMVNTSVLFGVWYRG